MARNCILLPVLWSLLEIRHTQCLFVVTWWGDLPVGENPPALPLWWFQKGRTIMQLLPCGKNKILEEFLLFSCFIFVYFAIWMKTPRFILLCRVRDPEFLVWNPKELRKLPGELDLGVFGTVVCWYTTSKCHVHWGWGFLQGTPRALERPALLQAGKQGPEGAQIAVIDLGNPLPGCAEWEPGSWRRWGGISPFGNVSGAWNAVPPWAAFSPCPLSPGELLHLLKFSLVFSKSAWSAQIALSSISLSGVKSHFCVAGVLSKELFKHSRSSMYRTYYSHALAFV